MNITCNAPVGNGIGTCSREEELKRDTHQEPPQLQQSEHVATSAHTPDKDTIQWTLDLQDNLDRLKKQVVDL